MNVPFIGLGHLDADLFTKFNHVNGLQLIARAHQLVNEGYKVSVTINPVSTSTNTLLT